MPPTEASTQAETTPDPIAPANPEQAAAFKADSALDPRMRNEIQAAWNASIEENGELDPEEPAEGAPADAKLAKAAKPAAPAAAAAAAATPAEPEAETPPEAPRKLSQEENRLLMQARIAQNARFQRREQAQMQRFSEREAQVGSRERELAATYEPLIAAARCAEAGDVDGIAKGIGAFLKDPKLTDWTALNSFALEAVQNPAHKRMRQLEQQLEERTKNENEQKAQQAQQAQHQQQLNAIQEWKANLHDECVADDDPAVAALVAARPNVVEALFAIQQSHFHSNAGDELSAHDAASQFMQNVRNDFQFWTEFFDTHSESELLSGIQAAAPKPAKPANRGATLERQTAKKTSGGKQPAGETPAAAKPARLPSKTISQTQTAGASALAPMNDKQLKQHFERLIDQEWRAA